MGSFFIHGALAWATLGLISIPIIIHLINRRRFRRVEWAAMEFLLDALKKNRRRVRIEQLILLALRVALMALLGLLLARPVLSERGLEWLAGAFRSEEKVFVIDDSFSTSRREADRTAFQREAEALTAQLRRLSERSGGDRVTLLRASRRQNPMARAAVLDRERSAALSQAVQRLTPTDIRMPLAECIESVADAPGVEGGSGRPRAVLVLTDFRALDWTDGRGGRNEAVARALAKLGGNPDLPTRVSVLDAGASDASNAAIIDAVLEAGRAVVDVPAEVRVSVKSFGASAARGLSLRLRYAPAGAAPGSEVTIIGPSLEEIPPGGSATAVIPCTFRAPGHYGVTVEMAGNRDALSGDDSIPLAVEVVPAVEVLLVDGEPSSERFEGETDFLAEALAPGGEVASGLRATVATEDSLPKGGLERFAAVFIANLHGVPEEFLPRLDRYVRGGGTLLVFPGDQTDMARWNRELGDDPKAGDRVGRGLLPARIGELRSEERPLGFAPALDHPAFRLLRDAKDLFASVRFARRFVLEPGTSAQVVARFDDPEGSPSIVERAAGKGRVVLFASAADLEQNDWAKNPSYLMVLQELVAIAARSGSERPAHLAGAPVEIPVDVAAYSREARLRGPGYPSEPERTLLAAPAAEGSAGSSAAFRFVIEDTARAGIYTLALKTKSGEDEWRAEAVRRDPGESDLTPLSAPKLRELYPEADLTVIQDAAGFADVGRGRFEIADACLWLFVAFLFVECLLGRLFAHHPPGGGESSTKGAAA